MTELTEKTGHGAIIYDPEVIGTATDSSFTPSGWTSVSPVSGPLQSSGRGTTLYVSNTDEREFVLRQYLRGGFIGRFINRVYLWTGADNTRSFSEWRLLAKMTSLGLPVPQPAAARYVKSGPFYSAEILTVRIPGIRPIAERLLKEPGSAEFWRQSGETIGRFHAAGINHADLSAYNVQVDADDKLWVLDFDRGRISSNGPWRQQNIARLHRSFMKVSKLDDRLNFTAGDWEEFLSGYFSVARSA